MPIARNMIKIQNEGGTIISKRRGILEVATKLYEKEDEGQVTDEWKKVNVEEKISGSLQH